MILKTEHRAFSRRLAVLSCAGAAGYLAIVGRAISGGASASFLVGAAVTILAPAVRAESPRLEGSWKIDITFANGESRSLRFDAKVGGKGSFASLDPRTVVEGPGKPSEGHWTVGGASAVNFSGPFAFPLGNVGRDPGTLFFKGKFEGGNLIAGQVDFEPLVGGQGRHGTFRAQRIFA